MDTLTQDKLRKIVGMMGSENDGERANSARAFHKIVMANGGFEKLISPKEAGLSSVNRLYATNAALERTVTTQDSELKILRQEVRTLERITYERDALRAFVSAEVATIARTEGIRAVKIKRLTGNPAWKRT